MEVNTVLVIPDEFRARDREVAELALGAERVVFEKPEKAGEHMRPFIKGHLDGKPIGRVMVDSRASINIMPLVVFKRLGHKDDDLKKTNKSKMIFRRTI
jgi:hypothetical protein